MSFDEALNDCIERMMQGETLESCLASHPDQAAELRSLLEVGQMLRTTPPPLPAQAFNRGRWRMQEAALTGVAIEGRPRLGWVAWPLGAAVAILFAIALVAAVWNRPANGLLFPVRKAVQAALIPLTFDPTVRAGQHIRLAQQLLAANSEGRSEANRRELDHARRLVNQVDQALSDLALRPDDPRSPTILRDLVTVAYEARVRLLGVASNLSADQQITRDQLADQLFRMEQWAQIALQVPGALADYALDSEPPLLPALSPSVTATLTPIRPSTTPTKLRMTATTAPIGTTTPGSASPKSTPVDSPAPSQTAAVPGTPTRPLAAATHTSTPRVQPTGTVLATEEPPSPTPTDTSTVPTTTPTHTPVSTPTPTLTATATHSPVPTLTWTPAATPTATAQPITATSTATLRPATATPSATRPATTTPSPTEEADDTPESTRTPEPSETPDSPRTPDPAPHP